MRGNTYRWVHTWHFEKYYPRMLFGFGWLDAWHTQSKTGDKKRCSTQRIKIRKSLSHLVIESNLFYSQELQPKPKDARSHATSAARHHRALPLDDIVGLRSANCVI